MRIDISEKLGSKCATGNCLIVKNTLFDEKENLIESKDSDQKSIAPLPPFLYSYLIFLSSLVTATFESGSSQFENNVQKIPRVISSYHHLNYLIDIFRVNISMNLYRCIYGFTGLPAGRGANKAVLGNTKQNQKIQC